MTKLRNLGRLLAAAGRMMLRHEVPRDAAGISYFALLALFPATLVLIALADALLGWMNLHRIVIQRVVALFPVSRQFLRANLSEITTPSTAGILSCLLIVVWSSSWIFTFMESAINRAWGVSGGRTFWESRMRSVGLMVLGGFSLLLSAALTGFVSAARARAQAEIPAARDFIGLFWYLVLLGTGLMIAVLVFALIFKLTPHRKVLWSDALSGALVATSLWETASYLFLKTVPFFDYQRIYGKMGAMVALLAWVYTSNLIMLFGANFSAQLHGIALEEGQFDASAPSDRIRRFPLHR